MTENAKSKSRKRSRFFKLAVVAGVIIAVGVVYMMRPTSEATPNEVNTGGTSIDTKIEGNVQKLTKVEKMIKLANEKGHAALLEHCRDKFIENDFNSYTCTFVKQEEIRGKLLPMQHMKIKFRQKPFSVAMHVTKNPGDGDKMIYIEGENKDSSGKSQMIVRPKNSLARMVVGGSLKVLPDSDRVMKTTLRPCTEFGIINSFKNLIDVYKIAIEKKECQESIELVDGKQLATLENMPGKKFLVLKRIIPTKRKEYPAKVTWIYIDIESMLPLYIKGTNWKDKINCIYQIKDLDLTAKLGDADFTKKANKF